MNGILNTPSFQINFDPRLAQLCCKRLESGCCKAKVPHPEQHLVRLEFQEVEGGSHVRFSQFGELPGGNVEATKAGMESYFDNLGLFLQ
jgi:hypothetical protein